jgi:hypothetical protein
MFNISTIALNQLSSPWKITVKLRIHNWQLLLTTNLIYLHHSTNMRIPDPNPVFHFKHHSLWLSEIKDIGSMESQPTNAAIMKCISKADNLTAPKIQKYSETSSYRSQIIRFPGSIVQFLWPLSESYFNYGSRIYCFPGSIVSFSDPRRKQWIEVSLYLYI